MITTLIIAGFLGLFAPFIGFIVLFIGGMFLVSAIAGVTAIILLGLLIALLYAMQLAERPRL